MKIELQINRASLSSSHTSCTLVLPSCLIMKKRKGEIVAVLPARDGGLGTTAVDGGLDETVAAARRPRCDRRPQRHRCDRQPRRETILDAAPPRRPRCNGDAADGREKKRAARRNLLLVEWAVMSSGTLFSLADHTPAIYTNG